MMSHVARTLSYRTCIKFCRRGWRSSSLLSASVSAFGTGATADGGCAAGDDGAPKSPARLVASPSMMRDTDVFIFDIDGVIWKGDTVIDKVPETLAMLRRSGKKVFFVTNNSTKSRLGCLMKFKKLGLDVDADEIISSSFAAAAYLEKNPLPPGKKVYVVGQEGIGEELDLIGVPHLGGPADNNKKINLSNDARVEHDPDVGAVVVGLDTNINYYKIQYAQLCLNQNPGCRFIATNLDAAAHVTAEQEWAAAGAMVGAIAGCTHQKPILVGKPSPLMIDYIAAKYGLEQRSRICMVGDRLDTDVLFGQRNGLQTILTLTGVTTKEKLFSPDNSIRPTYYADSVADLLQL